MATANRAQRSTTVSRALDVLALLREEPEGVTMTVLADRLGVQRAPLYRIVNSLLDRRLLHRNSDGRYVLGNGLRELASPLQRSLDVYLPELQRAANTAHAAVVLVLEDHTGGLRAELSVSPETEEIHVVTPVGHRFSESVTLPRLAIDAQRVSSGDESGLDEELRRVLADGYATSAGQVLAGAWAVAFPVRVPERYGLASVMLVTMHPETADQVTDVGRELVRRLDELAP